VGRSLGAAVSGFGRAFKLPMSPGAFHDLETLA
jgi:hypothetical protein